MKAEDFDASRWSWVHHIHMRRRRPFDRARAFHLTAALEANAAHNEPRKLVNPKSALLRNPRRCPWHPCRVHAAHTIDGRDG